MRIDTHRHLGGSIPPAWVWETIQRRGWYYLAETYDDVKKTMVYGHDEPRNFYRFLDKFKILDEIIWDEELIDSSIESIAKEINRDSLDFVWLDFSINKYMHQMKWSKKDAVKFIYHSFQQHIPGKVGLILSLKYESMRAGQKQYSKLIEDPEIAEILFGIDLVGDEAYFDAEFYRPIFAEWNNAGKMTRAHVAESQTAMNAYEAITVMKVTNIAHGIKICEEPDIISAAIDNDITFDLGITSNFFTGVVGRDEHPVTKMLNNGLRLTLGTDDPIQCNTTLDDEFLSASRYGVAEYQHSILKKMAEENTRKYLKRL
jgi:adenosine deaminase